MHIATILCSISYLPPTSSVLSKYWRDLFSTAAQDPAAIEWCILVGHVGGTSWANRAEWNRSQKVNFVISLVSTRLCKEFIGNSEDEGAKWGTEAVVDAGGSSEQGHEGGGRRNASRSAE